MTIDANIYTGGPSSIAGQLAVLEITADDAAYHAECASRDAARAAEREHQREQVEAMRDKASALLTSGIVEGGLEALSGAVQIDGACKGYGADMSNLDAKNCAEDSSLKEDLLKAVASMNLGANIAKGTVTLLGSVDKAVDLGFKALEAGHDADAADAAAKAEHAKTAAEDASAACQRNRSGLDAKLAAIQELFRSDAETMRNLIHPA